MKNSAHFDVVIIGAGAAGLFCAGLAGRGGARVLVLDHAAKVAEKIRISGGGRCNFTNLDTGPANFLSANPHFCRSALARFKPSDFLALLDRHRIGWHEKHKGQLFCDESSEQIIAMLLSECELGRVTRWQPCEVSTIHEVTEPTGGKSDAEAADRGPRSERGAARFDVATDRGGVSCRHLVVATGGLSIPKIGASDFGYRVARQFDHQIVPTRPALVPLTFETARWAPFAELSGLSVEVSIEAGEGSSAGRFAEDLLFTHRGLSGPAVLQISSFWQPGGDIRIDFAPGSDLAASLLAAKKTSGRQLGNELATLLPARLATSWLKPKPEIATRHMAEVSDRALKELAESLHRWCLRPDNTEGYRKAEVTAGGVDTRQLDSRSMESKHRPGLYFIGEVVDVTGWLGGYNFQWAWASAAACAEAVTAL